ncbi:MAG: hypothetical protein JNL40_04045 [Cyclobacteriaceae bacterium]|nr:hypothetical protein [Cyclobacteriaceae bacterium]
MDYSLFQTTFPEEVYAVPSPLTVILDRPWSEQPAECREALTKLLAAVRQSPESVRMIHQETLDLSAWAQPPSRLVAFVKPQKGIALNEKISTPATEMVVTEPLSALLTNEESKRKFWTAFRTLFTS